jgi:hypothetical protein
MVPTTSIAGRHAADRQRDHDEQARQELVDEAQDHARQALVDALRAFALQVHPHLDPRLEIDRSIWVDCRLDRCDQDHALVQAIVEKQGWAADRARCSRSSARYDIARVVHKATGAALTVIVKLPHAQVVQWEAA